jgi:hypothetical protein
MLLVVLISDDIVDRGVFCAYEIISSIFLDNVASVLFDTFLSESLATGLEIGGLNEACNFLEYRNVYAWHKRIVS